MPYLLRKYGMPVDRIAGIVAIAILPSIWSFFWAPLADTGLRRRSWVIVSAVCASAAMTTAILDIHGPPAILTALLFLGNAFTGLLSAACGALLSALPETVRGRAAGWYQAGNIGAGTLGGGLAISLGDHTSLPILAMTVAAAMLLPALAALLVQEAAPIQRALGPQLLGMAHDLRDLLKSRRTWLGLVFFLSPVGTMAIGNLISGVGQDYHASGNQVALFTGVIGGCLSAAGCFVGGFMADRMSRMKAYALTGGLTAIFGAWLALGPATPFTFAAAFSGYSLVAGIAYAVYTALLLDVVGKSQRAAAFAYSVLNGSGNAAIAYMVWLDGLGYKRWGARGLMGVDTVATAGGALILLMVAIFAGHHWHHRNDAPSATTPDRTALTG